MKKSRHNELIIGFESSFSDEACLRVIEEQKGKIISKLADKTYLVNFESQESPDKTIETIQKLKGVRYAEPNAKLRALKKNKK